MKVVLLLVGAAALILLVRSRRRGEVWHMAPDPVSGP